MKFEAKHFYPLVSGISTRLKAHNFDLPEDAAQLWLEEFAFMMNRELEEIEAAIRADEKRRNIEMFAPKPDAIEAMERAARADERAKILAEGLRAWGKMQSKFVFTGDRFPSDTHTALLIQIEAVEG